MIAGNLLSSSTRNKENESKAKYLTQDKKAESVDAMKNLDECLTQLAVSMMSLISFPLFQYKEIELVHILILEEP